MKKTSLTCWHVTAGGAAIVAVLTVVGYLATIAPIRQDLAARADLEAEVAAQRTKADVSARARLRLAQTKADLEEQLEKHELQLESADHLNTRIAEIAELIDASGMVVSETELDEAESGPWYQTVPIEVTGVGSWPDCARFLQRLHEQMPDTGVVALELSGNPGAPDTPARFRLSLVWYAAPQMSASVE